MSLLRECFDDDTFVAFKARMGFLMRFTLLLLAAIGLVRLFL